MLSSSAFRRIRVMVTREFQLLLCCARSQPNAVPIKDLVSAAPNWQILLELAKQHGVRPMLLRSLKSVCWDAVPQTIQRELDRFNRANLQKSMALTGELFRLLEAFQQKGIPITALKGPVLAELVYGNYLSGNSAIWTSWSIRRTCAQRKISSSPAAMWLSFLTETTDPHFILIKASMAFTMVRLGSPLICIGSCHGRAWHFLYNLRRCGPNYGR